ncbi:dihydrofolate reductase [Anaerocolumna xylanovorans]|uniref:Dihydrofolate reductase n=1 Tax=Anaerocolumna xylanovorans DSM 12503 TaxID=1121345 RepID=A0A1M7YDW0_9FIRM|nr:dihydrofolate reductase [Anaerocolumna xylanovorans]SHO50815.1 dihydrofolate reductase [Anaerocolumna xylanovorans DSM 12503]
MNLIVAVDRNWAIGYQNKMLISIPEDMRFFRDETIGKAVIMGRKTMETFQGGKPLKNRLNVVITSKDIEINDAVVVHSIEEALEAVKDYKSEAVYVVGGESIYRQMIDYCDVAHVTKIDYAYHADTYFPNLDEKKEWKIAEESEERTYYDIEYAFYKYVKAKK